MAEPIIWNRYEVALLIYAYENIKSQNISKEDAVKKLSLALLNISLNSNKRLDTSFKNVEEVSNRLDEVEYFFDENHKSAHINFLFRDMVRIYRYEHERYLEILSMAREKAQIKKKLNTINVGTIKNNKELLDELDSDVSGAMKKNDDSVMAYDKSSVEVFIQFLNNYKFIYINGIEIDGKIWLSNKGKYKDFFVEMNKESAKLFTVMDKWWIRCKDIDSDFIEKVKRYDSKKRRMFYASSMKKYGKDKMNEGLKGQVDDLVKLLCVYGVEYYDLRMKQGCLWVVDSPLTTVIITNLIKNGIDFHYGTNGGRVTKGKSAWWLKTVDVVVSDKVKSSVEAATLDYNNFFKNINLSQQLKIKNGQINEEQTATLFLYLDMHGIEYVDNRALNNTVNIIESPLTKLIIDRLRKSGLVFKYRYDVHAEIGKRSYWWVKVQEKVVVCKETEIVNILEKKGNIINEKLATKEKKIVGEKIVKGFFIDEINIKAVKEDNYSIQLGEELNVKDNYLTFKEAEKLFSKLDKAGVQYIDEREKDKRIWIIDGKYASSIIKELRENDILLHYKFRFDMPKHKKGAWWIKAEATPHEENYVDNNKEDTNDKVYLPEETAETVIEEESTKYQEVKNVFKIAESVEVVDEHEKLEEDKEAEPVCTGSKYGISSAKGSSEAISKGEFPINDNNIDKECCAELNYNTNIVDLDESEVPLASIYNLDSALYRFVSIEDVELSVRLNNCFIRGNIENIEQMLMKTEQDLLNIRGFGKGTLEEVKKLCGSDILKKLEGKGIQKSFLSSDNVPKIFQDNITYIIKGEWNYFDQFELSEEENKYLRLIMKAHSFLGEDLVNKCIYQNRDIDNFIKAIFSYKKVNSHNFTIKRIFDQIIPFKCKNRVSGYIVAYNSSQQQKEDILSFYSSPDDALNSCLDKEIVADSKKVAVLEEFLKWCNYDVQTYVDKIVDTLLSQEKYKIILQGRFRKKTLEEIGNILGLTRERVRQIESKLVRHFTNLNTRIRLLQRIYADRDCDAVLTISELYEYFGEYNDEICYLLEKSYSSQFIFDKELEVFVFNNESLYDQTLEYVEKLPKVIKNSKVESIFKEAEEAGVDRELLEKVFIEQYKLTGDIYHRDRLSRADVYSIILKKYYPNGIKVYSPIAMQEFRRHVLEDLGDIGLPKNDRALYGRIADICVLCGRGYYKLKSKEYISKELTARIHYYIKSNKRDIILTNSIFYAFKDELIEEGIDNKYYLHGILHEIFNDEFYFKRDYVSKKPLFTANEGNEGVSRLHLEIRNFIKASKSPVSKKQIYQEFPGITEIVIAFAVDDHKILNYFGEYLHTQYLSIESSEKEFIKRTIDAVVADGKAHHWKEIYDKVNAMIPEAFTRSYAMNPFSAYSIVKYLFNEKYEFLRPYISKLDVDIERPSQRLHQLIQVKDCVAVAEIRNFAKENYLQICSMLDYLNSCNEEFAILNNDNIIKFDYAGINASVAEQVENIIVNSINGSMPIRDLTIWAELPTINVPWTDWLVYSIIKKWGSKLSVAVSDQQMRLAVPLIALGDEVDSEEYKDLRPIAEGISINIDDMDNIDDLLDDVLNDMWEENI